MPALGHRQAETVSALHDNPTFNAFGPENHLGSGGWSRHGQRPQIRGFVAGLSWCAGAHQAQAARKFERLWITFIGCGRHSSMFEPSPVHLFNRDGLSEKQAAAASELRIVRALIGVRNFSLLVHVCGEGRGLRELGLGDPRGTSRYFGRPPAHVLGRSGPAMGFPAPEGKQGGPQMSAKRSPLIIACPKQDGAPDASSGSTEAQ